MFLVSIFIYFCSHLDYFFSSYSGFPNNSTDKESAYTARDPNLIPGLERSPGEGIGYSLQFSWASLVAQMAKNPPAMPEMQVQSLGREDPLEKEMQPTPGFLPGKSHGQRT